MNTSHPITRRMIKGFIALSLVFTVVFAIIALWGNSWSDHGTVLAGVASAETATHDAPAGQAAPKAGPANAHKQDAPEDPEQVLAIFMDDSVESLAEALRQKERALDEREKALEEEEKRLESLRLEIEQNLARMDQTLKKMEALAAQVDTIQNENLNKWIEIYQTMPPEDVAKVIEGMDTGFAVLLLSEMVPKKAGEVLSKIDPKSSIMLNQYITERKNF